MCVKHHCSPCIYVPNQLTARPSVWSASDANHVVLTLHTSDYSRSPYSPASICSAPLAACTRGLQQSTTTCREANTDIDDAFGSSQAQDTSSSIRRQKASDHKNDHAAREFVSDCRTSRNTCGDATTCSDRANADCVAILWALKWTSRDLHCCLWTLGVGEVCTAGLVGCIILYRVTT